MKNHKSITNSFDRILSLKQNKSFLPPFFKLPSNRSDLNENRIDTRSSKLSSVTSDIRISFSGIEGWIGVPCRSRSRRIQIIKVRAVYKNQFIHWPRLWCTCGGVDRFNKWRRERGKQRGPDMVARERGGRRKGLERNGWNSGGTFPRFRRLVDGRGSNETRFSLIESKLWEKGEADSRGIFQQSHWNWIREVWRPCHLLQIYRRAALISFYLRFILHAVLLIVIGIFKYRFVWF